MFYYGGIFYEKCWDFKWFGKIWKDVGNFYLGYEGRFGYRYKLGEKS